MKFLKITTRVHMGSHILISLLRIAMQMKTSNGPDKYMIAEEEINNIIIAFIAIIALITSEVYYYKFPHIVFPENMDERNHERTEATVNCDN